MEEHQTHHEGHEPTHETHHTAPAHHAAPGAGLGSEMAIPKFDTKNMDFQGGFMKVLEIFKLNQSAIEGVAKDEKLNFIALIFLIVGVIAGPLANYIFGSNYFGIVYRPTLQDTLIQMVVQFVIAALLIFISTLVATKVFNGKGTFAEFFRIMGLAYIVNVLAILVPLLPSLGMFIALIAGVWLLVIEFISLKSVFKLDATNAVLTMLVTIVAFLILGAALASVGLGAAMNSAPRLNMMQPNIDLKLN